MLVVREICDVRHHYDVVDVASVEEAEELFGRLDRSKAYNQYLEDDLNEYFGGAEVEYLGPIGGSVLGYESDPKPTLNAEEIASFIEER